MAPHPTQTLHFVSFPEVQQHLTLFLILCWENLFGVIFYHRNEQRDYAITRAHKERFHQPGQNTIHIWPPQQRSSVANPWLARFYKWIISV